MLLKLLSPCICKNMIFKKNILKEHKLQVIPLFEVKVILPLGLVDFIIKS